MRAQIGLEGARETADQMGAVWRTDDVLTARDFTGGLHANLLTNPSGEGVGRPSDAAMIIVAVKGEAHHRQWHDERLMINGFLAEGRPVIIPAGVTPRAVVTDPVRVLHIYAPSAVLRRARREHDGSDGQPELVNPQQAEDELLSGPMTLLARALDTGRPVNRLWLDAIGMAIVARTIERWSNVAGMPARPAGIHFRDWRVRRAIEYLEARLAEDVGLFELAAAIDLSPSHLAALFRAGTGEPPHRWLMKRRVERACEMLLDPRKNVTGIAHALGFASSQHLATVFKKCTGATPTEYRRGRQG